MMYAGDSGICSLVSISFRRIYIQIDGTQRKNVGTVCFHLLSENLYPNFNWDERKNALRAFPSPFGESISKLFENDQ